MKCLGKRQPLPELDQLESFRTQSARLVSLLVRALGPSRLTLAEDAVQETFLRAVQIWPLKGVPPNPSGWLTLTAKRIAVDMLRREKFYSPLNVAALEKAAAESADISILGDAELEMLFLCCNPSIPLESRIALTLRELCGLSTREVAKGLMLTEDATAQRLVRAKKAVAGIEWGSGDPFEERLSSVLQVIYLMFNEGYASHSAPALVRSDLCDESILLANRLSKTTIGNQPSTHALQALMLLHSSRLPARVSPDGSLCLLEEQDRTLWDQSRIDKGMQELKLAAWGEKLSPYHMEAGIAACHALAPSFAATDWNAVLGYYDELATLNPSPVILLNRAIALAMVHGPEKGLGQLKAIEGTKQMASYYLLPATRAKFYEMLGRDVEAREQYALALTLAQNPCEAEFLRKKLHPET